MALKFAISDNIYWDFVIEFHNLSLAMLWPTLAMLLVAGVQCWGSNDLGLFDVDWTSADRMDLEILGCDTDSKSAEAQIVF